MRVRGSRSGYRWTNLEDSDDDEEVRDVRVLIAEDEALIRMDLREMLEEEGHEIVGEARDGAEAVALARTVRPDIVFMDVKMPHVNGIEAAAAISAEAIAPVVMVTAFSQAGLVEEAARAGAMGYVVKPFSRNDIVPAMQVAVSRYSELTLLSQQVGDLEERLETRKVLDRAKGILMAGGFSEPEAFHRLQKLAMDKRKSLREVAEAVITAHEVMD
jgi:response regulator NasT